MKWLPSFLMALAAWLVIGVVWFALQGRPFLSIGCGCAAVLAFFIGYREADALNHPES